MVGGKSDTPNLSSHISQCPRNRGNNPTGVLALATT
jgi:hypothetical protein